MSGPFGSSQWMYASGGFYNGVATQSLRFDDGSSSSITREFVTPTNLNKWTINLWVKRGNISTLQEIIGSDYVDITFIGLRFLADNTLNFLQYSAGGVTIICNLITTQVFRDTSAWYNIQINHDTSASGDDRQQIWVNGVKITSYSTGTRSANSSAWNRSGVNYHFGKIGISGQESYFDGYISEINCVDGLNLDPSYFGEFKNGVWIAKNPVVSDYGNNGFRLQFKNTGTGTTAEGTTATTNIGDDSSGNGHNFSVSGINSYDCVPDSPENNFCTLNPLQISDNDSNFFPSEGNLKLSANNNNGYRNCSSTFSPMGFKGYFEFTGLSTINFYLGPIEDTTHPTNQDYADGNHNFLYFISDGQVQKNQGGTAAQVVRSASDHALGTISTGDVLGMAFDFTGTNRNVWLHRANTYGTASGGAGNPATGANPVGTSSILDSTQPYRFNFGINNGARLHFNFGQDSSFGGNKTAQGNTDENGNGDFYYTPPSGFLALCSANLPEPTISPNANTQADDYFNTVLYTGNGGTLNVTGVGFAPDWVWIKDRGIYDGYNYEHALYDTSRGVNNHLRSSTTGQEGTQAGSLTAFGSDGFTLGSHVGQNTNNESYVAWNWKANGGTTSSNTDGSITSTVQANTDAGFSIVTYTGSGTAGDTVGHGLGATPKMVIYKTRSASGFWHVYHEDIGAGNVVYLNATNASGADADFLNSTAPTSTLLTLGASSGANGSGTTYVAYCFAEIEGYSKFGSYTGNGNSPDGTFVYTGFRPAWLMVKRTDSANNWIINDETRTTFNEITGSSSTLYADTSNQESDLNTNLDFLSNGFKARTTAGHRNASGGTYIYMAFAENPFKYANAR